MFQDEKKKQFGVIKVRFSDLFEEMLEFEVEIEDDSDGDKGYTTVNW